MSLDAKPVKLGLYWDPCLHHKQWREREIRVKSEEGEKNCDLASSVFWQQGRLKSSDIVGGAVIGEKNTHFRSQKQMRHYRAAATTTSTKTTTVVSGDRVIAGNREKTRRKRSSK